MGLGLFVLYFCVAASALRRSTVSSVAPSRKDLDMIVAMNDRTRFDELLAGINVPRVVGSAGHAQVQQFIIDQLQSLEGCRVSLDGFREETPVGSLQFTNIVATCPGGGGPSASSPDMPVLVLAAHYDSKLIDGVDFFGTTDSSVPCAMIIDIAKSLNAYIATQKLRYTLKLIFFDGEEAFRQWTAADSLYGSRHLAGVMDVDSIDLFILLDLIGHRYQTPGPFRDFWKETTVQFDALRFLERKMRRYNLLKTTEGGFFSSRKMHGYNGIEDDHVPFLRLGVPVLHMISTPFPEEWHTPDDNLGIVDFDTVMDLLALWRAFLCGALQIKL